jgi:hypothetical protein
MAWVITHAIVTRTRKSKMDDGKKWRSVELINYFPVFCQAVLRHNESHFCMDGKNDGAESQFGMKTELDEL